MLCTKMCRSSGFGFQSLCVIIVCTMVFSCSQGRPKENADVVDMQVEDPAPDQDELPVFVVKEEEEDSQKTEDEGLNGQGNEDENEETHFEVPIVNVHDARSRAVADYLKLMPYKAGDTEEIMHGGSHVHGEEHEGPKENIGVGGAGMDDLIMGVKEKEEDKGAPSTVDTEQLMHDGEGGEHGHNPHQGGHKEVHGPSAENPEDLLHMRDMEHRAEELGKRDPGAENPEETFHKMDGGHHHERSDDNTKGNGQNVGVSIEEVVHGDGQDHNHDEEIMEEYEDDDGVTRTRKLGKEITAEDIENLGLSQKDLEGIDLGKLLRRDQSEYETWKKDQLEQKDKGFWEKVDEFRSNYFNMLSKKIRHLSRFDNDDDPEWEEQDDDPHPGESKVDHESELWGSTKPKGKRRRKTFTVIKRQTHDGTEEL